MAIQSGTTGDTSKIASRPHRGSSNIRSDRQNPHGQNIRPNVFTHRQGKANGDSAYSTHHFGRRTFELATCHQANTRPHSAHRPSNGQLSVQDAITPRRS